MKNLLLMRHAKSAWDNPALEDVDRTLNERGLKDAPEMGKRIAKQKFNPDLIICSIAKRSRDTAHLIASELNFNSHHILVVDELYKADLDDLMHLIRNIDEKFKHVIMVGHNPTFTGAIGYLGDKFIDNLPTSGLAWFEMNIGSWKQTTRAIAKTKWIDFPKNG